MLGDFLEGFREFYPFKIFMPQAVAALDAHHVDLSPSTILWSMNKCFFVYT